MDRRQIVQYRPRLFLRLDVHIAQKSRFRTAAAMAVRHELIAVLGNLVQRPFRQYQMGGFDAFTQAKTFGKLNVVVHPGRVVGVCSFEGAIPTALVAPRLWIIVGGHADNSPVRFAGDDRNILKLLRVKLHQLQRRFRVAQLGVDDFSNGFYRHLIGNTIAGGIGRDAAHTDLPAG